MTELGTTVEPTPALTSITTAARVGSMSAVDAARTALALVLAAKLEGVVPGDGRAADRPVRLTGVYDRFPTSFDRFRPPCGSILEISSELEDFVDELVEDVADNDLEVVPQVQETSGEFSVDLWARDPAERKALKAAFAGVFRLGNGGTSDKVVRSVGGASLMIELPNEVLPRSFRNRAKFRMLGRFTVAELPRDLDDPLSAAQQEWRAQARVTWDAEVVSAADAEQMLVLTQSAMVVDLDGDQTLVGQP